MAAKFFKSIRTFGKNISRHASNVLRRRESARDALSGVASDMRKLGKHAANPNAAFKRKEARKLLEQGREAYNAKNDAVAEEKFREAMMADDTWALAYTYLGNALYRQGRTNEALSNWRRAVVIEPDSEGAARAQRKLQRLARKKKAMNSWLDDRLDRG
jgi:tetratricopeptide (TPR) repeat protein